MNRIVVSFRWCGGAARSAGSDAGKLADQLVNRATALGGRVVAWDSGTFTFDFTADAMADAIELAVGRGTSDAAATAFTVGVSEGELDEVVAGGPAIVLSLGPGLVRAMGLARIARSGEVLVDPLLELVRSGELLTRGSRLGTFRHQRVRGLVLDVLHPWRNGIAVSPSRLALPALVGRSVDGLVVEPGAIGVVAAGRGLGGTRLLTELGAKLGAALLVTPQPIGEPLGALRMAVVRSQLRGHAAELGPDDQASLRSLLAGEGLDVDAGASLIAAWAGTDSERYVLVDDADGVDLDTLEFIAAAGRECGVRIVLRVPAHGELPSPFVDRSRTFELRLAGLPEAEAQQLALAYTSGQLQDAALKRVARRGGNTPLGIAEALREGLESGDLEWKRESVAPRSRSTWRGDRRSPAHWMFRRLRFIDADARALLDALTVFGGEAELDELAAFLEAVKLRVDLPAVCRLLEHGCWIESVGDRLVALSSATLGELLDRVMAPDRNMAWHHLVARLLSSGPHPLATCRAAVHALCSDEPAAAKDCARRAAGTARAAGLAATAEALDAVVTADDLEPLTSVGGRRFPPERALGTRLEGSVEEAVESLVAQLRANELI